MSEPITHKTTHTFAIEHFANPFLVCNLCKQSVVGYIVSSEFVENLTNYPCGHIGVTSTCPSWSPVGGCRCLEHLGSIQHSLTLRTKKNIFEEKE